MKNLLFTLILYLPIVTLNAQNCNNLSTAVSPDGLYIYFTSDRDGGNFEIYKANIDGTNVIRLTNSSDKKSFPSLSPNGTKVLFQSADYSAASEIYMMNNDGTNLIRLTNNNVYDGYPNFSPDGQSIVFSAWDNSIYPEIFTMNQDGTNRTQITNTPGSDWYYAPKFNPAGTKIYFLVSQNGNFNIVMMDLNGSNWINVTPPNTYGYIDLYPSFSSDGLKIVFSTSEYSGNGGILDLIMINADGSGWQRITTSANSERFDLPVFHPTDNSKLFFSYTPSGGRSSIKEMNTDGTGIIELAACSPNGLEDDPETKVLSFYPNPANDFLNVNIKGEILIKIFDLAGRLVLVSRDNKTNISQLNPGIYAIYLKDENSDLIRFDKLIKN
jgi:Tol biopolymer transport system component